jgi:hypothetical protein
MCCICDFFQKTLDKMLEQQQEHKNLIMTKAEKKSW